MCYIVLLDSLSKMWPVSIRFAHHTGFWWENLMKRHHLEELDVGGKKCKSGSSRSGMGRLDCSGQGQRRAVGDCECGNEPTVSGKFEEFF
jgi:hypothetical protein